jgi:single-stranded-DNA-specific exonuclease
MNWEKKDIPPEKVKEISAKYGCDLLTASILTRRGITTGGSIKFFLEEDERFLHNPFDLPGMEDAVERILAAKEEGEKVLVFGDSDVDGITGTVLLTEYLGGMGVDVSWRIPGADDPYGLSLEAVEEFAGAWGTLIVTVDCGISRLAEIKRANELSVDVIVTDHHEPQDELPEALAIINPKLKDTTYPFKDLSGCAVAFKLVSALRFAQNSGLYGQPMCLLNTRPLNDAWIVEAVKMRNLAVIGAVSETIIPGMLHISDTRLPAFLEGQQILVWDAPLHKRVLAKLFGTGVEIGMLDVAPEIGRTIPPVAGKSLLRIKELSAVAKYSDREAGEIDVFANLFRSYAHKRENHGSAETAGTAVPPGTAVPSGTAVSVYETQLAALGTIGDIMPLLDENRIIVRSGVRSLIPSASGGTGGTGPKPGISELLDKLELSGSHFDVKDLAWKLCPAINAGRRMGSPETAAALFFEKDAMLRDKLALELVAMNKRRKQLEEEIWGKLEPMAYKTFSEFGEKIILVYGEEINRGVTGLIAQRAVRRFNVPAVAVSFSADVYTGSIRSVRGFNIGSLLEQCGDLFIDSGGHEFAGGFSLKPENWELLNERLKNAALSMELAETPDEAISIDAELPLEYLTPDILNLVDRFAPYGKENDPLVFLAKKLFIEELNFIGKNESRHLRMTLATGKYKWPALFWDAASRVIDKEFDKGDYVDAAFTITRDWYKGKATPQMMICDLQKNNEKGKEKK